jgi:hypothetical protein
MSEQFDKATDEVEQKVTEQVQEEVTTDAEAQDDGAALKFYVAVGDCDPIVYSILVGFTKKYSEFVTTADTVKNIVEDINTALVPVADKWNSLLLGETEENV